MPPLGRASASCCRRTQSLCRNTPRRTRLFITGQKEHGRTIIWRGRVGEPLAPDFRWRWEAAVACPDRKTVVIEGDGCGMYTVQALWSIAREKADVTVVLVKNDSYAILNIELARAREGDDSQRTLSMLHLDDPTLDWSRLRRGRACQPAAPRPQRSSTSSSKR